MSKIAKATTMLMFVTLIAKVLGFGREVVLASVYGTSAYSDAFLISFNIPTIIFAAVGSAIATTYIPIYYEIKSEKGKQEALKFTNNVFNVVVVIGSIIAILGMIFTEPLVKMSAMGFKGETLRLTIEYTRILIVSVLFIGLSFVMTAYLQVNNNFTLPGLVSIPKNIIIIASIILSSKYNPYIIAYGTLLAIACEFLVQYPFAHKKGFKYKLYLNLKDDKLKKMLILIAPIFIGVAVNQVNTLIDRSLASTLVTGSISALNYANKLIGFVVAIFIVSISAVVYPLMSRCSAEENKEEFVNVVTKSINSMILLVIPVSVGAIVLAKPIVQVLFERGAFNSQATMMTSVAVMFYAIGLVGNGLTDMLGKVFYSLKDTKTPMKVGILSVTANIILNVVLIKYMKHAGLALATSLSTLFGVALLFIMLKKKISYFGQDKIKKAAIKSVISAIVMGIGTYFVYSVLANLVPVGTVGNIISLFGSILIGVVIYGVMILLLKVEETEMIVSMVQSKFKIGGIK